ncbi:DNA polymerase alpha subunit B [Macadamia integrifolia]|uniref:DNA polymerase alpha subunit B n=1 Tax=Macadamia integrifolia TaxID=60698 RepID=UPI001C4E616A|nr:DNA polymerase alpha subunit B [Macadamia integrifolia]XP_042506467.1 DNA polymerase alpha subunit B [Macadamia integrifolia]
MEEEIKAQFERSGFSLEDEEEVLKKCLTFCINFKLGPSDLVSSWEVYYLNRQLNGSSVQNAHMDGFLLYLQNEQKDLVTKEDPNLHIYSSNDVDMILNDEHEDTKEGILGTPVDRSEIIHSDLSNFMPGINGKSTSGKQLKLVSNHITPFGQRKTKFVVQLSFNNPPAIENGIKEDNFESLEDDVIKRVRPSVKCSLLVHVSQPEPGCRFMYDRIEDRFSSLEDRIIKYANALVASELYEEPTDPTVASQKSVFSVGMVCCDGEGRLNEKSILLQSSVEHSGGQRVRLDIQKLTQFSFFPGQVVGVEGHNPSGHCLVASKVVDAIPFLPPPDMGLPPAKKQALDQEFQPTPSTMLGELSLVIAAGPFTTSDNLLFEPLVELLAYASRKQPQLLMLLGPFVDSEHPEIKKGTVHRSFVEVFRVEILRRLQDYAEFMGSAARVILVPSIRDANHDFVYPQPAFDIHPSDLKNQISSLSNPSQFYANEVKVGCCTVDILKQLSGEEISRNPANGSSGDRMSRLAIHLLSQHSFYPLYPPSEGVPLDLSLAPEAMQISSIPDILVLPSDLAPFVKVLSVDGRMEGDEQSKCICVNPGRSAKGIGGGTFVELNYHKNLDRTSASIIRI